MNRPRNQWLVRTHANGADEDTDAIGAVGIPRPALPPNMSLTRRTVLEQLAAASDAERRETTTVEAVASALDADVGAVERHLDRLAACELARFGPDGRVRATITGEELLVLDTDELVIVDPGPTRRPD